jgi:hypothetical protein
MSVVHAFSGGVTLPWLVKRIEEWDGLLAEAVGAGSFQPPEAASEAGSYVLLQGLAVLGRIRMS